MKSILVMLVFAFGLASFWDAITTFYGTYTALQAANGSAVMVSGIVTLVVSTLMISSAYVLKQSIALSALWFFGLAYSLYTSFMGTSTLVLGSQMSATTTPEEYGPQLILLLSMTIFTTAAPVIFSYLIKR